MAKKEIALLKKQIDKLDDKDFDLEAWKKYTIILLARIFGDKTEKIRQIESIDIAPQQTESAQQATTQQNHLMANATVCLRG